MKANGQDADLQRFARLAAPMLQGVATCGVGSRASGNRAGAGLEFLDLRDYVAGDDIRRIDWRQTSRRQSAVIRRFRDEAASDWFLLIDRSGSVTWGKRKWPMTVQLASALAYSLLFAGHRVSLLLFSDRIDGLVHLGRGAQHYAAILDLLSSPVAIDRITAASRANSSNIAVCCPLLKRNSNAFVISDFLQVDGMATGLAAVAASVASVNALQVLDENEVEIPRAAAAELRDVETHGRRSLPVTDTTVARAQQKLHTHGLELRKHCASIGMPFTSCTTAEHWQEVLLDHLQGRALR